MTTAKIILGIALLALIVLVNLWLILRKKKAKAAAANAQEPAGAGNEEIDLLIREAENRLAAAKLGPGAHVGSLPVYVLLGDTGSTKTSVMMNSGLDAELLAGQVYQNNNIVPTRTANLWFSRRAIFAEAGGKLPGEPAKWARLVKKLQPRASVVGKGEQAPRAAVVFFDCENFTKPGAQDLAVNAARTLRARLGEISQALGIHLPVYVLFTRMDRLPFLTEYVRNLTNDEATQVLGVTLPMLTKRSEGVYAEEETARLAGNFERLFRSLADARPEFLARETDATKLPASYEFPREFRKLRPALVQFLVDLCRPSQLTVAPFLRGFYFTGVRPIVINEMAPVAAARPQQQSGFGGASGATGIFRAGERLQAPQPAAAAVGGSRKVPQWMFLSHLFTDVLLADRAAMGASGASTKTSGARRMLFAIAAGLCFLLSIFFTISFFNNRALETEVSSAARGIASGPAATTDLASLDGLQKLDTLRQSLETLVKYKREGAPWWTYRWGLYIGNDLLPEARRVYFDRFRALLFGQTQGHLLKTLRDLPPTPGPEYQPTYDALKAYLITTSNHDKSTEAFLSPVSMNHWSADRTVDTDRRQLARKQFDFYARELQIENPYSKDNDVPAVEKARRYLKQFGGVERVYAAMLADARKNNAPINFNKQFPGSAQFVVEPHEVPGEASKGGWGFMKDALQHPDRYFTGEQWVLGDLGAVSISGADLEVLRSRYYRDFGQEWRTYVKSATVVRYAGLKDASEKLRQLSGNQSPLLALLCLASQNTAVDEPKVANAFQPVQTVVPPSCGDRYIARRNAERAGGLRGQS